MRACPGCGRFRFRSYAVMAEYAAQCIRDNRFAHVFGRRNLVLEVLFVSE